MDQIKKIKKVFKSSQKGSKSAKEKIPATVAVPTPSARSVVPPVVHTPAVKTPVHLFRAQNYCTLQTIKYARTTAGKEAPELTHVKMPTQEGVQSFIGDTIKERIIARSQKK
ncbi:unnamed protein product [Oikopleura dioica]|uniref:Uncharacterized protein n=1 Tax=Oikopleura dioica TaxID=34765 RepID=E4XKR8_OIKDI|nr:unnamed protein product [Oikopleura dioica]